VKVIRNLYKQLQAVSVVWPRRLKASGVASGGRPCGRKSTLFAVILNVFLSRNLDQIMLKNAYFFSVGGSAPELLFASGGCGPVRKRQVLSDSM